MAYLDNSSTIVDAILTKKGRELLSRGIGEFNITQFALSDDEIDYNLWNPSHPLGTLYYGEQIENLPMLEAFPDETSLMKYKLVTLPKRTAKLPVISVSQTQITLTYTNQETTVKPITVNYPTANDTFGYTAILSDSDAADLIVSIGPSVSIGATSSTDILGNISNNPTIPRFISDSESARSITVIGLEFKLRAKQQLYADKYATLTIIANQTGGSVTIPITVKKVLENVTPGLV